MLGVCWSAKQEARYCCDRLHLRLQHVFRHWLARCYMGEFDSLPFEFNVLMFNAALPCRGHVYSNSSRNQRV